MPPNKARTWRRVEEESRSRPARLGNFGRRSRVYRPCSPFPRKPATVTLSTPTASFGLSTALRIPRATARAGRSGPQSMVANTRTTCRRRSLPQTPRAGRAPMCPSRKAAASWTALASGWRTRRAADRFRFFFLQAPCREERGAYYRSSRPLAARKETRIGDHARHRFN